MIKGFPVGTMLFFETVEDGQQTYILVDGLQRGNSIKRYMNNPKDFFYDQNIPDEFCKSILQDVNADKNENCGLVRSILMNYIKEQTNFKNQQYYVLAKKIADYFEAGEEAIGELIDDLALFFKDRQDLYDQVSLTIIPVIVYKGDEQNLPEIFDKINSQGTPLDKYEVYAASWPVNKRFKISNMDIIEYVIKKYDSLAEDGVEIYDYNKESMRDNKEVTAFEYLFGLSKFLVFNCDILAFQQSLSDDTVNPLGFELVNACLNDTDKTATLYKNIYAIEDIDSFEKALLDSIHFVADSISPITMFKGNNHSNNKIFHSKYQIMSMISTTFKEMYKNGNYKTLSNEWCERRDMIAKNLRLYYVYDIITDYWGGGVNNKMFSAAKPNRYATEITSKAWQVALDGFFEKSMTRKETKKINNPQSGEYVLLNCIYLSTFTAGDQLSPEKFDVEHIAPKEQMKKLIKITKGEGLPVSCIANLCYLPEAANRSKRDKNFYQDDNYLKYINIEEVESKYSFTTKEDLEWMDMPYLGPDDYEALKQFYVEFCNKRFQTLKKLFCESMGINYEEMT